MFLELSKRKNERKKEKQKKNKRKTKEKTGKKRKLRFGTKKEKINFRV